MFKARSYSIDELEALTGFNQRTISYYIQQGLLPKVGRRGRSTRYPRLFADRLQFVKRVRELQDFGQLGSVTLPRIARVIWHLAGQSGDEEDLAELSDEEIQRLFSEEVVPEARELGVTSAGEPVTASFGKFGAYVKAGGETASIEAEEFNSITLLEAQERITRNSAGEKRRVIQDFQKEGIQILDGPYGAYARGGGVNAWIPKHLDPTEVSASECLALLDEERNRRHPRSASRRRERLSARLQMPSAPEMTVSENLADPDHVDIPIEPARSLSRDSVLPPLLSLSDDEAAREDLHLTARKIMAAIDDRASRSPAAGRISETWTRAPITKDIEIAVQGIEPEYANLVETLAEKLRLLLGIKKK